MSGHTHTHTYTQDNYSNPRCAHARRGLIMSGSLVPPLKNLVSAPEYRLNTPSSLLQQSASTRDLPGQVFDDCAVFFNSYCISFVSVP